MNTYGPETAAPIFAGCFVLAIWLVVIVLTAVIFCKIFSKAGYHWAMGLLMLIPIANFVMLLILAFGEWPIQRQLKAYRQTQQAVPSPQSPLPLENNFRNI